MTIQLVTRQWPWHTGSTDSVANDANIAHQMSDFEGLTEQIKNNLQYEMFISADSAHLRSYFSECSAWRTGVPLVQSLETMEGER